MDGENVKDDDKIDILKISNKVLKKFEPIWRNTVVSDLQRIVNGVAYGFDGDASLLRPSQGCYFSFGNPKENGTFFKRLGGKYFYDLTELVSFTGKKMSSKDIKEFKNDSNNTDYEQRILITVLSHLLISDLDVLKNKNNSEKSIVDCMRQIIMSRYMEKGYSLENIPGKLFYICYDIVDNAMKDYAIKLNVPWFETAKSCVAKNLFGGGRHWGGKIGGDLILQSQNLFSSPPMFKSKEKLPDGTEKNLKLKLVNPLDYMDGRVGTAKR